MVFDVGVTTESIGSSGQFLFGVGDVLVGFFWSRRSLIAVMLTENSRKGSPLFGGYLRVLGPYVEVLGCIR